MTLSQDQLNKMLAASQGQSYNPATTSVTPQDPEAVKANQDYLKAMSYRTSVAPTTPDPMTAPAPAPIDGGYTQGALGRVLPNTGNALSGLAGDFMKRVGNAKTSIDNNVARIPANATVGDYAKGAGESALAAVGQTAGFAMDAVGEGIKGAYKIITPESVQASLASGAGQILASPVGQAGLQYAAKGMKEYDAWKVANPEAADNLESVVNIASLIPAGKVLGTAKDLAKTGLDTLAEHAPGIIQKGLQATDDAIGVAKDAAGNIISGVKDKTGNTIGAIKDKVVTDPRTAMVNALDPELSGSRLTNAYKDVVKNGRSINNSGVFSEQSLNPAQKTVNLADRLSGDVELGSGTKVDGVKLEKDPAKNLQTLSQALKDTEERLGVELKSSDSIVPNKDALYSKLNDAVKNAPQEFRIKGPGNFYKNVFDYAKKVIGDSKNDLEGLRDARTAFDSQAKTEFPSAFDEKTGTINEKTSAGAAIKAARDLINEHLYNTAPNGSDLQKLIGRESDIFRATDSIAPKAAKGDQMSLIKKGAKMVKDHPVISSIGAGLGAYETAKTVTGN